MNTTTTITRREKHNQLPETCGMVPPQATDIEEIVLAGLMGDSEAYYKTNMLLSSDSFYKPEHQSIYLAIQTLAQKGKPIDVMTVTRQLHDTGKLEEVGGAYALTIIYAKVSNSYHIEHHARIVAQTAMQRELIRIGRETAATAFDATIDIDVQIGELRNKLAELENMAVSTNTGKTQSDVLEGAIREIEQDCMNQEAGKPPGLTTGLTYLNKLTGGWRDTNLIILAARPGIGKTSLALHFAKVVAQTGKWVNFYGLEMTSEDLMRIMISAETNVPRINIRDGLVTDAEWDKINKTMSNIQRLPFLWYDDAGVTATQIEANTRRNVKKGKCSLVVVDYLQLITPTDKKVNREQQVAEITRQLKRTALENKVPIILLSQLNREAADGVPGLHHLRESGAIEQDADVVIFPWRDKASDDKLMLTVAKNRRGKLGTFEIQANEEMTRFDNAHQNSAPPPTTAPREDWRYEKANTPF